MMGPRQGALFYEFSLEDHVPPDHLLRSIDRFVDLGDMRRRLAPFYSSTGRPSVDPELMIRMLLLGYCFGIRSERRLCEEVHQGGLRGAAFGAATPVKPKAISPSERAARLTSANGDRPFFAYSTNYLVDLDHAIIVDGEP
jgi:Transposase domain (DUF772)